MTADTVDFSRGPSKQNNDVAVSAAPAGAKAVYARQGIDSPILADDA
jgi:hypothetical protein